MTAVLMAALVYGIPLIILLTRPRWSTLFWVGGGLTVLVALAGDFSGEQALTAALFNGLLVFLPGALVIWLRGGKKADGARSDEELDADMKRIRGEIAAVDDKSPQAD